MGRRPDPISAGKVSDRSLGVRTSRKLARTKLGLPPGSSDYEPTPWPVLDDILTGLDVDFPKTVFVDLGSGKGRILCLAVAFPFLEVIGVEASEQLHLVAQDNLQGLPDGWAKAKAVRSVRLEAERFLFPKHPLLVYLYNPFGPAILRRVLARLMKHEQPVTIAYYEPAREEVLACERGLDWVAADRDWVIYSKR